MSSNTNDELLALADKAANARDGMRDPKMKEILSGLAKAAEEVGWAWSGSNLGHHAVIYWEGLERPPPHVQFSAEWGLQERLASNRPNKGWKICDPQHVTTAILRRAGGPDVGALESRVGVYKDTFFRLKEEAISLLTVALAASSDKFIARKLEQVERLGAPDPTEIFTRDLPREMFSRDRLALSQGFQAAPHQCIAAFPRAAAILEDGLDQLDKATREAASHLRRVTRRHAKAELVGTNVFVGHGRSSVWRELKDFIEDRLGLPVDEFNSVPVAGVSTTARLSELLEAAAFAFLIMTAEDEQADGKMNARLNVVHEVGMFQGRLGFNRAIILLEEGCEEFSNVHGLGQIRFPKGGISAKFEDIRAVLEREGLIEPPKARGAA